MTRNMRKILKSTVLLFGLIFACWLTLFFMSRPNPEALRKLATSRGLPVSKEDLYHGIEVDDQDNAVEALKGFKQELAKTKISSKLWSQASQTMYAEAQAKTLLDATEQIEPSLAELATKKRLVLSRDWLDPQEARYPELDPLLDAAIIKCRRAESFAALGQRDLAIKNLEDAAKIAGQLNLQPDTTCAYFYGMLASSVIQSALDTASQIRDPVMVAKCRDLVKRMSPSDLKVALRSHTMEPTLRLTDPRESHGLVRDPSCVPPGLIFASTTKALWGGIFINRAADLQDAIQKSESDREIVRTVLDYQRWCQGPTIEQQFAKQFVLVDTESTLATITSVPTYKRLAEIAFDTMISGEKPVASKYASPANEVPTLESVPDGWALIYPGSDGVRNDKVVIEDGIPKLKTDLALIYHKGNYWIKGS